MTKEEILIEAKIQIPYDQSNKYNGPIHWEKYKNKIDKYRETWVEGVLSDTARKHWEPKWIPVTPETMPTEAKMYNVLISNSKLPFVDFFKLDLGMFDFDLNNRYNSIRITHYSPLPTFND